MKQNNKGIICPPCGENVGLPTKKGANKALPILPLLPCLTAVLPPQGQETTTRGFTLIELLVVVLIIGILSAVAVPQYQKAVYKSRYATLKNLTESIWQAQQVYHLANGRYATTFAELDIDLPTGTVDENLQDEHTTDQYNYPWGYCRIRFNDSEKVQSNCTNQQINMGYFITEDGRRHCFVFGSKKVEDYPIQNSVCQTETGLATISFASKFDGVEYARWTYPN